MARLWLLVPLIAACGPNIGVSGLDDDKPGDTDEQVDDDTTCDGNAFTLRIDDVAVAAPSVGFDLDEHHTQSSSDPIGCGKTDAAGGIDNAFASLEPSLSGFGVAIGPALVEAISSGDLRIDITIAGLDDLVDDDCVLVDVTANGDPVTTSEQASVQGGVLSLSLDELPLSGEIDVGAGPMYADVTARDVELDLPLSGNPVSVTGGLLGAGLPWDEPNNEADLRVIVQANVSPSFFPLVEGIVLGLLDLQPPGSSDSASCDAMSAALLVDAHTL